MPKRILVADDEEDILKLVTARLIKRGYEVHAVANGRDALDRLGTSQVDLVILDYHMPELSGEEVSRRMKQSATWKHIPVLFISASQGFLTPASLQAAGASDFLIKPFEAAVLLEKVARLLDASPASQDHEERT